MLSERQLSLKRTLKQQIVEGNMTIDFVTLSHNAIELSGFLFKDLLHHEVNEVVSEITKEEEIIFTPSGTVYDPKTFKKWIKDRCENVQLSRWNSYKQLLVSRDWAKNVISELESQTDEVVELLGDPSDPADWARRGLLLGEVQSGKTATYIGILNKAIDYGYRLIIVIGGHTNDLRRQTQVRLDSDLIGYDTSLIGENISSVARPPLGVAKFDRSIQTNVLTTVDGDFSKGKTRSGLNWIQEALPTVIVIKKHATVIQNVTNYIKQQTNGGRLDMPLVLIDDEADWGTPNTGSDTDPTRVNAAIRRLLDTSRRSSYLGITATPFANIFIDHETDHHELGQDLFPADYIRVMSSPSNYRGMSEYFSSKHGAIKRNVDDCIDILPIKHKKSHHVIKLPESLEDAIIAFYLGSALRLKRKEGRAEPASMLVNISRFNDVQAQIEVLIVAFIKKLNDSIAAELNRKVISPLSPIFMQIMRVWDAEFAENETGETWQDVASYLSLISDSIRIELVNSATSNARTKRRKLLTKEQRSSEDKMPTIFIGGDVLARGLTLEGLQVSYFVREPRTMDTLMQMGRWFGYRHGYEDLVRIWISRSTEADFSWSTDVTQELRELLLEMRAKELTPRDFGLRLRAHPGGFEVVAGNKRQNAVLTNGDVLIHGNKFESYYLDTNSDVRRNNILAAESLLLSAQSEAAEERTVGGYRAWRGVSLPTVQEFFTKFRADKMDPFFGFAAGKSIPQISAYLDEAEGSDSWDVVLVHGSKRPVQLAGIEFDSSLRNSIKVEGTTFELGNRRVATASNLAGSLNLEAQHNLKSQLEPTEKMTEKRVLEQIDHPMLLVYALTTEPVQDSEEQPIVEITPDDPLIAVVLAFPAIDVEEAANRLRTRKVQKFWVNTVWWNNMRGYLDDGDDIDSGDFE